MTTQDVTVHLPDAVYEQLKTRARLANRTVEAEVLHVVATAVPVADGMTPDLTDLLAQMQFLDDATLTRTIKKAPLPQKTLARFSTLNDKKQREGLNAAEIHEATTLLQKYERAIVIRAKALALLKERGHDISWMVK